MRFFTRPALVKAATTRTISNSHIRHLFETYPHFSRHQYPFLPVHFASGEKNNNFVLDQIEDVFTAIQTTRNNNAADSARLLKQLAEIKENEKALAKSHHDAFKSVFYEFTQHWMTVGGKLQESPLFEKFEALHDDLEKALLQESFSKGALEKALSRIQNFIKRVCGEEKRGIGESAEICSHCLSLLLRNLDNYTPQIITQEYKQDEPGNASCKI